MKHPVIWVTQEERVHILQLIEENTWVQEIVNKVHLQIDEKVKLHQSNPSAILEDIPKLAPDDNQSEFDAVTVDQHADVLRLAANSSMLYYLTQSEEYAQFAADILYHYALELAPRTPETTSICGNAFYDPRTSYAQFALAYDFAHPYLKKPKRKVYQLDSRKNVRYDDAIVQKAIKNMVGNTLQEYGKPDVHGQFISNHPILTAPGALFGILCVEDDTERERLFDVFWNKGTNHQNSFKNTILPMFGNQGIWPESTSYSFMSAITLVLNIVDRVYPDMDVTADHEQILKGNFLFDNLKMPNGIFVRYGDSKRFHDGTTALYRYTLNLANRRGYDSLKAQAIVALKQSYQQDEKKQTSLSQGTFGNYDMLKLFWAVPLPEVVEGSIDFRKPTVVIEHAGVVLKRNETDIDNELFGLCGIIGGAHYVHSHVTGISMELYGAGYAMAPNAGLPPTVQERRIPLHEKYFRLYAGNNTVIVNGTSHGRDQGSWKGKANVWQNTTINIAAEPAHLEDPLSESFSFATQHLDDEVNDCVQERTLATIRTSPTTAYYFDLFRSKSNGENKFHDYIYHNIGDRSHLQNSSGESLELSATDRYQNDIGDVVQSPGWRFFEDTKVTKPISESVYVRFDVDYDQRYMHMFLPGGGEREYTKALAPPTREAINGYVAKKTQVLAVRQNGEAWERPFLSVFEPGTSSESSLQSIEEIRDGNRVIGAKVVSKIANAEVIDYILCMDRPDAIGDIKTLDLKFVGRFGMVRKIQFENGKSETTLYIGEGQNLQFGNLVLDAGQSKKGIRSITQE
ncbi:hypothetical protein [Reichenbachiella ulvae]|uniref:Heparinase II/III-like protein n=1 Tax=Reichenbachiella ulvae TaxID=2980104 RepID=A0ABT3CSV8_9BACT|nr:hypothetical protein [Reichenbachiella ulvae]MCV9386692.1 hypothetical protein [Reichenbachiella ulvae]